MRWQCVNNDNFLSMLKRYPLSRQMWSMAVSSGIPLKEIRESFDFVDRVRKFISVRNQFQFKKRKVLELCCGHGFIGALLLKLKQASLVHQVDINETKSNKKMKRFLNDQRLIYHRLDIYKNRDFLLDLDVDVIIGCHLCGDLTDFAIDLAIEKKCDVCVVPCCYGKKQASTDKEKMLYSMFGKKIINVYRTTRLIENDYSVRMRFLKEAITPMNKLIIGNYNGVYL